MKQIIRKELVLLKDLGMLYPNNTAKYKVRFGIYECFCGIEFKANSNSVKHKIVMSCGCNKKTHGLTYHRLYKTWNGMMQRCHNPNNTKYKDYGGRGINVCERWKDIKNFIDDMYPTFIDGLELDRKNNNKGYSLDNCRWTTRSIQLLNTRLILPSNTSGYRGVSFHKRTKKWRAYIKINGKQIYIGSHSDIIECAKMRDNYIKENNLYNVQLNFKD